MSNEKPWPSEFCDWDHSLFGRFRRGREPGDAAWQWVISCCPTIVIVWNSARSYQVSWKIQRGVCVCLCVCSVWKSRQAPNIYGPSWLTYPVNICKYYRTNLGQSAFSGTKPISNSCWPFIPIVISTSYIPSILIIGFRIPSNQIKDIVFMIYDYDELLYLYIAIFKKCTPNISRFDPIRSLPIRFPLDLHSHTVAMTDHGDCPTQPEVTQTFSMTPAAASSEGIGACNWVSQHDRWSLEVFEQKEVAVFFFSPKRHQTQIWVGNRVALCSFRFLGSAFN